MQTGCDGISGEYMLFGKAEELRARAHLVADGTWFACAHTGTKRARVAGAGLLVRGSSADLGITLVPKRDPTARFMVGQLHDLIAADLSHDA